METLLKTAIANAKMQQPFGSPCIDVCRLNPQTGYCEGCFRTLEEIRSWKTMTDSDKRGLFEALLARSAAGHRGKRMLMIQGTASSAGKSTIVAGLCRLAKRAGLRVSPFKPQNMSLNSVVATGGGEMSRAQAWQAFAAGVDPHTDMNPILLKPNSSIGSQVIIQGRVACTLDARSYQQYKPIAMRAALDSFRRIRAASDIVFIEGAGSPAEVNLRHADIANMGFAEAVDCPVVLVADIDRGGMFAQVIGTLECLSERERARIAGVLINRFRGDLSLLKPGIDWLEAKTRKPVFGVIPYLHGLWLDQEDDLPAERSTRAAAGKAFMVVVPALPHLSNHTDFEPLRAHPQVDFRYVRAVDPAPAADLIILPGSKNVHADLLWLRQNGWDTYLLRHLRYGGKVIGICAGMKMLGRELRDRHTIESSASIERGLNLLNFITTLQPEKRLANVSGKLLLDQASVCGYEIHMGKTHGPALQRPAIRLEHSSEDDDAMPCYDGAISADNQIFATYLHGLFDAPAACCALLEWAGLKNAQCFDHDHRRQASIDQLADVMAKNINLNALWSAVQR